ncbi:hypothetical protein BSQ39_09745 [Loigolactobacillus backii]|uniref:helix-turn-helix domain-containing protein n=1 Tax=Loigolactobacillus backii TaxID=375175 RepID=UPI000C1C8D5D|nr:helix-turn-helix domain-containing protein [Loigolactobacillus backii]PIO83831.1 hypothetical protein BSQ39_09745 [Loigolactobacillus backii]
MNYKLFFEKEDLISYSLLQVISQQPNGKITENEVLLDFSISSYRVQHVLETLNHDLKNVKSNVSSYIDTSEKKLLHGINITTTVVQSIRLMYLKHSLLYAMFEYHFIYSNQLSNAAFMKKNFISKTTFYNSQNKLKDILQQEDFYQVSSEFGDNEHAIRLHLFQFFYTAFNGIDNPFAELDAPADQIIESIQTKFQVAITPTQRTKLLIFLKTWILRMKNQCFVTKPMLAETKLDALDHQLLDQIQAILSKALTLPVGQIELDYLETFLVIQGYKPGYSELTSKMTMPLAYSWATDLMTQVKQSQMLLDNDALKTTTLESAILRINIQFTTFYVEPTTFISLDQVSFFKETYPLFDQVISHFIQTLHSNTTIKMGQNDSVNLYFSYMFAFINNIPINLLRNMVYICVDFSQGKLYTDYVIRTLTAFSNAHIMIERIPSPETDIYLSDFYNNSVQQIQITWRNPPTPLDWSLLGDTIIDCKKQKMTNVTDDDNER